MSRYAALFERMSELRSGALVPFAVLGDPDRDRSVRWIERLIDAGADAIELGFPFSDPIADGPVIQQASQRALRAGSTVAGCFASIERIRSRHPDLPIGLLVYANLVVHRGLARFYAEARKSGVDSVLVADVPLEESEAFSAAAEAADVAPIMIVPPNASVERIARIVGQTRGYTYVTTRAGVTGEGAPSDRDLATRIAAIRAHGAPPPLVGFGISSPADVRYALDAGAAGIIVGSALIRRAAESLDEAARYFALLKAATQSRTHLPTRPRSDAKAGR